MKNTKMFDNILGAVNKMNQKGGGGNFEDKEKANAWRCETDKAGNGYAVIRFLPPKTDDQLPFVKKFDHGFQGPGGKWFIEGCPTTIDQPCPVCDANSPLWNSGIEANKEIVRKRKRRLSYTTNVLVVSDSKNPENEGKVFTFKFGKKIFDKITEAMSPPRDPDTNELIDPDYPPINPFDLEEGANFKLKIRKVDGYANFDKSEFEKPSAVDNADEIMDQLHDLTFIDAAENFKSYEELETKLNKVLNSTQAATARPRAEDPDEDDIPFKGEPASTPAPAREPQKAKPAKVKKDDTEASDDADLDYFRKLAGGDGE